MSSWFSTYGLGEVHPGLFIGAYPLDDSDVATIDALGVDRVLNLVQDAEYRDGARREIRAAYAARGLHETRMDLVDFGNLPEDRLDEAVDLVDGWLADGQRTYVHCRAGWQRSASVAAGVIAVREALPIEDALVVMRRRKPSADPLPHQREDLLRWWRQRG